MQKLNIVLLYQFSKLLSEPVQIIHNLFQKGLAYLSYCKGEVTSNLKLPLTLAVNPIDIKYCFPTQLSNAARAFWRLITFYLFSIIEFHLQYSNWPSINLKFQINWWLYYNIIVSPSPVLVKTRSKWFKMFGMVS